MKYSAGDRTLLAAKIHNKQKPAGLLPLFDLVAAVREGRAPDVDTLAILAERFEKIMGGAPADKALKLQRGKGNKVQPLTLRRNIVIASLVLIEIDAGELRDVAIQKVAAKCHKSFSTVEQAYDNHRKSARQVLTSGAQIIEAARNDREIAALASRD